MNTSKLQAFATDARRQLMNAVQARLDAALVPNSDAQVDDPRAFDFLQREIEQAGGGVEGRRHVVERYAYRWFNRIIAFRYMDVHGFTGTPVVSPAVLTSTNGLPEVLAAAKRGEYDSRVFSLRVNDKAKERIEGLLSGSILADDPQGRAYGLLLQSECRFWNHNLPFMFENVGKEAGRVDELLMPADLLAEGSVLRNAVEIMTPEDCGVDDPSGNVEIIGWLYQYYISERKNEVMDGFKKNHKAGANEIPAATQLFTLPWAERFEGMRGDDQRRSVQHLGKVSGQACIPRVRVDNVGVHIVGDLQIDAERLQRAVCFLEFLGNVVSDDLERTFRIVTRDFGNLILGTWSVKRTDRHIHAFRQNFGKLLRVHACAAIHLGRIFTGKDVNLHICALLFESGSCSITTVRQFFNETPDCFIRVTKFCIFPKNAGKEVNKPGTNSAVIRDSHVKAGLHPSIGCSPALRSSPCYQTAVPF